MDYFTELFDKHIKRKTSVDMFSAEALRNDDGLRDFYGIALVFANADKAHAIGKTLIAEVIRKV